MNFIILGFPPAPWNLKMSYATPQNDRPSVDAKYRACLPHRNNYTGENICQSACISCNQLSRLLFSFNKDQLQEFTCLRYQRQNKLITILLTRGRIYQHIFSTQHCSYMYTNQKQCKILLLGRHGLVCFKRIVSNQEGFTPFLKFHKRESKR